jgi:hypothetical protein
MVSESTRLYAEEYWRNVVLDLAPDALIRWNLGDTRESCRSCLDMAALGEMRVDEFVARGVYPQSHELDCHGYNCQCFLVVVDSPALDVDKTLGELTHYGTAGDEGLAALYNEVHAKLMAQETDWSGLTPLSAGKSWFDAPASSAGSFKGLRYGDTTIASQFEQMATPPNLYPSSISDQFNQRISFTVVQATPYSGMRYGSDEPMTMGEQQWLTEPEHDPVTLTAPPSSSGSFTGERYGD